MAAESEHVLENKTEGDTKKKKKLSTILDIFNRLAHKDTKSHRKGALQLIKHLKTNRNKQEDEIDRQYALKRLIRGLGGTQLSIRETYYTTLTVLLQNIDIDVEEILKLAEKELQPTKGDTRSEQGNVFNGQILLCGVLVRSNVFFTAGKLHKSKIINTLVSEGKKRVYLELLADIFLTEILKTIDRNDFEDILVPALDSELNVPLAQYNLNKLYILFNLNEKFPKIMKKSGFIETKSIVSKENIDSFTNILYDFSQIKLHLSHPFYAMAAEKVISSNLINPFIKAIEDVTSGGNVSLLKYHLTLNIYQRLAQYMSDKAHLPLFFRKQFLDHTTLVFAKLKSEPNEAIQRDFHKFLQIIVEDLQGDDVKDTIRFQIVEKLISNSFNEQLTKSNVTKQLIALLKTDGVVSLAQLHRHMLGNTQALKVRLQAAQAITRLINHPQMRDANDWKVEQLKVLADHALTGKQDAQQFKETFFNSLNLKVLKLEHLCDILAKLVAYIKEQIAVEAIVLNEAQTMLWKKTLMYVKKSTKQMFFHALFLQMALLIFDDMKLAGDSLNELFICFERFSSDNGSSDSDDDDINWVEVIIDLFLNLLSHRQQLLRNLIDSVFPHVCQHLTPTALHQILSVLDANNEENLLSDDDEDLEEDEDEEEEEEEEEDDDQDDETNEESEDEETITDKLRLAVQQALGGGGNNDADNESVDMDAMSDEECEQLNNALGAAFIKFKPQLVAQEQKKRKKQTEAERTVTCFRIRVIDLLDVYLTTSPSMFNCLEIMLPLLKLLEFTFKDEHQMPLKLRILKCLKQLTSLRTFSKCDDVTEDILCTLLDSLLQKGEKSLFIVNAMIKQLSDCCLFITRCIQMLPTENLTQQAAASPSSSSSSKRGVIDILQQAIEKFFVKRDCKTPYVLFTNLFLMTAWPENVRLARNVCDYIFDAKVLPFKRSQAILLLRSFYANRRLQLTLNTSKELTKLEQHLKESLRTFFTKTTFSDIKEKFVANLFNLLSVIRKSPSQQQRNVIDWREVGDLVTAFRAKVILDKETRAAFQRLCNSLQITWKIEMSASAIKLNANNDVSAKKGDLKRPASTQTVNKKLEKKMKKEANDLRMASLSGGFDKTFPLDVSIETMNDTNENSLLVNNGNLQNGKTHVKGTKTKKKKKGKAL